MDTVVWYHRTSKCCFLSWYSNELFRFFFTSNTSIGRSSSDHWKHGLLRPTNLKGKAQGFPKKKEKKKVVFGDDLITYLTKIEQIQHAFDFLTHVQNPGHCSSSPCGYRHWPSWWGFPSQFQYGAAKWFRTLAVNEFKVPVLIIGKFRGYSESTSGLAMPRKTGDLHVSPIMPPIYGFAWWWSIISARLNPWVEDEIWRAISMGLVFYIWRGASHLFIYRTARVSSEESYITAYWITRVRYFPT